MELDWFTFVAQIINFLILLWLLQRFLYEPVLQVMENREKEITNRLEEAHLTLLDAQEHLSEYEQKLDQIDKKERSMMEEARQGAEEYRKKLLTEARYEIEVMQERWRKTVEEEKEQFLTELEKRSFEKILEAVRKIIVELANQELEHHVLTSFIQKIETISAEKIELFTSGSDHKLNIKTAFFLKKQDRTKVRAILKEVFGSDIECDFEEEPELGLGIEIRTSGWKMGWNLRAYLEELRNEVATVLNESENNEVYETTEKQIV